MEHYYKKNFVYIDVNISYFKYKHLNNYWWGQVLVQLQFNFIILDHLQRIIATVIAFDVWNTTIQDTKLSIRLRKDGDLSVLAKYKKGLRVWHQGICCPLENTAKGESFGSGLVLI